MHSNSDVVTSPSHTVRVTGTVRVDRRTKDLIPRLRPGDLAVISHRDLDAVAAEGLREARVALVVNAEPSITGRYPTEGPRLLLEAGIPILDHAGTRVMSLQDGERIEIKDGRIFATGRYIGAGRWLTIGEYERRAGWGQANLQLEIRRFVDNTLDYAAKEKDHLLGELDFPSLRTPIAGRHVLVVVRGQGYRDDLQAVYPYIRDVRPVLIAVDGGANAIVECGFFPDIIVGDMDSVSDEVLRGGAELIVHAYPDGQAPGWERVNRLGLSAHLVSLTGTSEDLALLIGSEMGAELIVAVGAHTHAIDFFEKGRAGMASTFLTRLRVGPRLVDAKGVSQLYRTRPLARQSLLLAAAALIPLLIVLSASDVWQFFVRLLWLQARVWLGI